MFFSDTVGLVFEPFGFLHIVLFIFVALGVFMIVCFKDRIAQWKHERILAISMASFALLWEISLYLWKIGNGLWTWDDGLPLGLCGMTLYVAMVAMSFHKKSWFEVGYYWTWGAIASVLFPDIPYSFDRFRFYQFMFGHMFFFFMYVYMIAVYRWIPTWKSWRKSVGILFVITLFYILLSNLTDTNIMFMREADGTPLSIFEGGSYLFYVSGVIGLAIILMTLWQLPWELFKRNQKAK
jgi:hypothetical integral membrane protein (TIGR02206 family)